MKGVSNIVYITISERKYNKNVCFHLMSSLNTASGLTYPRESAVFCVQKYKNWGKKVHFSGSAKIKYSDFNIILVH